MKKKTKIVCLYQVIMHYRLPFYLRLASDKDYDFKILYGSGKPGTKLKNAGNIDNVLQRRELYDIRLPLPFSPSLFFNLIKENPDVVFTEGSSSLINSSVAFLYSKIFRKKIVWWSLGKLKNRKYKGLRALINKWEHFIELHVDAIFTYSTLGKNYFLSRGVEESKIFVAVNVFDTTSKLVEIERTFIKDFIDPKFFNIGFIGTIEKSKNLELIIDVVKELNSKYSNVRLHIIGDGAHFKNLRNYSENIDSIIFYGRLDNGSAKILSNCRLLVLPGLGGLAIVEGMLNKLAIITGSADGTEYDLVTADNGFILDVMDHKTLYEKIEYLMNNDDVLLRMQENSYKRISTEFSFEKYYEVFKLMINKIIVE